MVTSVLIEGRLPEDVDMSLEDVPGAEDEVVWLPEDDEVVWLEEDDDPDQVGGVEDVSRQASVEERLMLELVSLSVTLDALAGGGGGGSSGMGGGSWSVLILDSSLRTSIPSSG